MTTPERSVEEREWILSAAKARDISMSINDADYIASHFLRQIQTERQKQEEVVEEWKDFLHRMQRCEVDSIKYFISEEWKKLQALSKPNNK